MIRVLLWKGELFFNVEMWNVRIMFHVNLLRPDWDEASKANLHTENEVTFIVDKKKPKKKRLPSFLHMFSKVQHLKGLMTVSDS